MELSSVGKVLHLKSKISPPKTIVCDLLAASRIIGSIDMAVDLRANKCKSERKYPRRIVVIIESKHLIAPQIPMFARRSAGERIVLDSIEFYVGLSE